MKKYKENISNTKRLVQDGVFTAILIVLGMIKLPSVFPGAEFQLSAPYAVYLASMVGFKRYLGIGICSSFIQFILGTHSIYNVIVAMVFRIVAGMIIEWCPIQRISLVIAGPVGTACARVVMAYILSIPLQPLLVAAFPGMIFTPVVVLLLNQAVKRRTIPTIS